MGNYKCKKMALVNAVNLSECNADLLVALGWNKGIVNDMIAKMAEASWLNKDCPGEPQFYEAYKMAWRDMQEFERAASDSGWLSGDTVVVTKRQGRCTVQSNAEFYGENDTHYWLKVGGNQSSGVYSKGLYSLSKPEAPEQKAEKEREEKARALYDGYCDSCESLGIKKRAWFELSEAERMTWVITSIRRDRNS